MNISIVSNATQWPGYVALNCVGFLRTAWRLVFLILPKCDTLPGDARRPPRSWIRRLIVAGIGQRRLRAAQNAASSLNSFLGPRFGCTSRLRSRLSSAMMGAGHNRLRVVLGCRDLGFNASIFFPPAIHAPFHSYSVERITPNAWMADAMPYRSQWISTLAR